MVERGAVEALKASVRGLTAAGGTLTALGARVEALADEGPLDPALLTELARCAAAMAIGAAAVRGLSESLAARLASP
jgi:hypothetical protein